MKSKSQKRRKNKRKHARKIFLRAQNTLKIVEKNPVIFPEGEMIFDKVWAENFRAENEYLKYHRKRERRKRHRQELKVKKIEPTVSRMGFTLGKNAVKREDSRLKLWFKTIFQKSIKI